MKRGISAVMGVVFLILFSLSLGGIIFLFASPLIGDVTEEADIRQDFQSEELDLGSVQLNTGAKTVEFAVRRGNSKLSENLAKKTTTTKELSADIAIVADVSESIAQAGWNAIIDSATEKVHETTLSDVPAEDYLSSAETFTTESSYDNLLLQLDWEQKSGYEGSEFSEWVLNIKEPEGEWMIGTYPLQPSEAEKTVDPPTELGGTDQYFSGISTKPQYIYIEGPTPVGTWEVNAFLWDARPLSSPPSMQDAELTVYGGTGGQITREPEIIVETAMKTTLKTFIDAVIDSTEDRGEYITYDATTRTHESLTSNKALLKAAVDAGTVGSGARVDIAIAHAQTQLTADPEGDEQILVLFAAGHDDASTDAVRSAADEAKGADITIFTLGIGPFVDQDLLEEIATQNDYAYTASATTLDSTVSSMATKINDLLSTTTTTQEKPEPLTESLQVIVELADGTSVTKYLSDPPAANDVGVFTLDLSADVSDVSEVTNMNVHLAVARADGDVITSDLLATWKP